MLSAGGGVPRERVLHKVLNFLERLDDRIRCTHEETVAVVERERIWEVTRVLAASSVRNLRIELMRLSSK